MRRVTTEDVVLAIAMVGLLVFLLYVTLAA